MSKMCRAIVLVAAVCATLFSIATTQATAQENNPKTGANQTPENFEKGEGGSFVRQRMDWFYKQRAFPHKHIPAGARLRALQQLDARLAAEAAARSRAGSRPGPAPISPTWTAIGPQPVDSFGLVSSGRVTAVAVDPTNNNVV